MDDRPRHSPKRLSGSGPAPCVGFLVDWLEDSRYHWQVLRGAMSEAYDRGANLLCFVGGQLLPPGPTRGSNWVYDLAHPTNVDGLVVLSGSLGNAVGADGLSSFCARYRPMPICSVAIPLPGLSSVCIDNETGMRNAVEHLVRVHGLRSIAFICGPSVNEEAELRLRVYREVLEKNGIAYSPDLVVPGDFTQPAGHEAIATLFSKRKLAVNSVGAIVAANDVMALGAIGALREQGIKVPEQIAVVGFDDIEAARFVFPPLTTVHQPLFEQGRDAVRIVLEQLRDPGLPQLARRHTELVTRSSCGCLPGQVAGRKSSDPPMANLGFDSALLRRRTHILADMARAARGEFGPAGAQWDSRLLAAAAEQIRGESSDSFTRAYDDVLRRLVAAGVELSVCNDVLTAMRHRLVRCIGDLSQRTRAEDFLHEARVMTTNAVEGVQVGRRMRAWEEARTLAEAGTAIVSARDLDELRRGIRQALARAGIPRCFVLRLEGDPGPNGRAVVTLAETPDGRHGDPLFSTSLPAVDVIRQTVLSATDDRAFGVFPTQFGDQERAVLVMQLGSVEHYGYEALRQAFTVALTRLKEASGASPRSGQ